MALAGLLELKRRVGIDAGEGSFDAVLSDALAEATALMERWCRRSIEYVAADITELFDGGVQTLLLRAWPVTTLVSVKEAHDYDFAAAAALTADQDFRLVAARGRLRRLPTGAEWLAGEETVQAVYRGGYLGPDASPIGGVSYAPGHIQKACIVQAAECYKRRREPGYKPADAMAGNLTAGYAPPLELIEEARALLIGERRI